MTGDNLSGDKIIIPARGTVWFVVFNLDDDAPAMQIDGAREWRRPVVGLAIYGECMTHDCGLHSEPLVVDELGYVNGVEAYLEKLVGDLHWDHTHHLYMPHVSGPVIDSPRIRLVTPQPY